MQKYSLASKISKTSGLSPHLLLLFLSTALALAAPCLSAPQTPADIIQLATLNPNYRAALDKIAFDYEQIHPNIDVKIIIVASAFETWIRTRAAAGGELIPDIYNSSFLTGYAREGKWVRLDDYLGDINPYTAKPWIDSLDMSIANVYTYGGSFYQIPLDYVEISIFYNKDIFNRLGLREPETWAELLDLCRKIQDAGYVPIAMDGDIPSFHSGTMGWLVRTFCDAYLRNHIPDIMSQPGDWDYDPKRNQDYEYAPNDPYSDINVVLNVERKYKAVLNEDIDFTSPRFKQIYKRLKELSRYFQPNFTGSSDVATRMFYRQKAAMFIVASPMVTGITYDFRTFAEEDRFEFGNFWFPPVKKDDPYICGPFRGVGGGGAMFAVHNKHDKEHEKRVVDFFMYLTTPESGKKLVEYTLADDQPLIGPMLIKGVTLPQELQKKYEPFLNKGIVKIEFRGLDDELESVNEWAMIAQEYFADRMSLDEFTRQYSLIQKRAVKRLQQKYGYDMNPATKDTPPVSTAKKISLNPFENGSLAVLIILSLYLICAAVSIKTANGPLKPQTVIAYILLLPTFLLLGSFNYFPALSGLYHAFTEWEQGREAVFIGLQNFKRILNDKLFFVGIGNMLILLTAGVFKATVVPFLVAEMIMGLKSGKLKYIFRTSFLLPMIVPGMVGILLWKFIYDPNLGLLNQGLEMLGMDRLATNWLGNPDTALAAVIFMGFPWIGTFGLLLYLAGLLNIPASVHEAFRLESENVFKRIWHVDLPLVAGQTKILIILTFMGAVQDFQSILIMTNGGPGAATYVPALRMYHQAFTYGHFGYGAALGFILFTLILIITMINLKVLKAGE